MAFMSRYLAIWSKQAVAGIVFLGSVLMISETRRCFGQSSDYEFSGIPVSMSEPCNNSDALYRGGIYCIAATTTWSGNNPEMPRLTYNGNGDNSTCTSYSYTLMVQFTQPGDTYPNAQSYGMYQSEPMAGNVPWAVDWSQNIGHPGQYSEGGNGWFSITTNGLTADGFDFRIRGENPSNQSVAEYLSGLSTPWWYGHALTWETFADHPNWTGSYAPGNIQFLFGMNPTGEYLGKPDWGKPDGFGLSQLDGSPNANPTKVTDNSLWTWTTNLRYGVEVANGNWMNAYFHFLNNYNQMQTDMGPNPWYPQPIGGNCNFTWNGTGNNSYWNADWINLYNGGYWEKWNGPLSGWSYGSATNPNYTPNVCSMPSYTI